MKIIGRKREKDCLLQCLYSKRPEFIVVYGRRRVGKTYLIREYFNRQFSFYTTGLTDEKTKGQLRAFTESLKAYGSNDTSLPKDWFEAFSRLRNILEKENVYREPINNKRVIFLDELPWMDTARSDFKSALDYFWNSWASAQEDLVLITCGSATSWIINNLLNSKKGFHNRVTRRIQLAPFSLAECEELYSFNDVVMTRNQMIECYMVFGGIPHYLNMLDSRLSLAQNINELCFKEYGELHNEYHNLFYSLFDKPEKHIAILEALSRKKEGLTRNDLAKNESIGGGSVLTKNLRELEECGFIRKFNNYTQEENNALYQLIDPFTLFSLHFIKNKKFDSWNEYLNTPGYNAWRGNSFEIVCINHINQIKASLGISGIETNEFSWRSSSTDKSAQIDLIIDRKDGVINLCEMKYTNEEYSLEHDEYYKLQNRMTIFQKESETKKAIHITLVSANGLKKSKYSGIIQNVISGEDLFSH
ncbi:AAA family ATPase [Pseudobutyrivibrio xylanivorans]|uniref:ATP-binding protein n=1 Tax=Pseudobutyrivibrio xylanivorans TaxID=185007 RepID=A0A5P6VTV1_PSEXY|nr:ATP-binding protein [Pseudobutyrivibrio xylanivorans]QFJ55850.1 ATP-binding protein [Pseudobutyrivibrio xylanivorans]